MKFILLFIFLFSIHFSKAQISYEEAFKKCEETHLKKKKENPTKMITFSKKCLIGAKIPIFEATTMKGKAINASYFEGKITIINFWFEGCLPCIAEIPGFNKIIEKFGTSKVNFLAITSDSKEAVQKFMTKKPWNFEHITDAMFMIINKFKFSDYPTTLVVDKKGVIVHILSGGYTDNTAVEEIQKKLNPIIEEELKKAD